MMHQSFMNIGRNRWIRAYCRVYTTEEEPYPVILMEARSKATLQMTTQGRETRNYLPHDHTKRSWMRINTRMITKEDCNNQNLSSKPVAKRINKKTQTSNNRNVPKNKKGTKLLQKEWPKQKWPAHLE
jgi:hypothetical protein